MGDAAYGIVKHVDMGYEEAVALARDVLKEHGFGVITEIDVRKTMREKLDVDFRPYIILGACNPKMAHQALTAEPDIGLMLPCNVVVYEEGPGKAVVEAISPYAAMAGIENDALTEVAVKVQAGLTAAMDGRGRARGRTGLAGRPLGGPPTSVHRRTDLLLRLPYPGAPYTPEKEESMFVERQPWMYRSGEHPRDDREYLELLTRVVFAAGLGPRVVASRWEGMREVLGGFEPVHLAGLADEDVERLLADTRLIRNRRKIEAMRANAQAFIELLTEHGSFPDYLEAQGVGEGFGRVVADLTGRFQHLGATSAVLFLFSAGWRDQEEGHQSSADPAASSADRPVAARGADSSLASGKAGLPAEVPLPTPQTKTKKAAKTAA